MLNDAEVISNGDEFCKWVSFAVVLVAVVDHNVVSLVGNIVNESWDGSGGGNSSNGGDIDDVVVVVVKKIKSFSSMWLVVVYASLFKLSLLPLLSRVGLLEFNGILFVVVSGRIVNNNWLRENKN